jgi:cell division septal protein FtsQ
LRYALFCFARVPRYVENSKKGGMTTMSAFPFVAWALTIVLGLIIYIAIASTIEKSGLDRLGATGNLFTCDPDTAKKKK